MEPLVTIATDLPGYLNVCVDSKERLLSMLASLTPNEWTKLHVLMHYRAPNGSIVPLTYKDVHP